LPDVHPERERGVSNQHRDLDALNRKIEDAIEATFGFRTDVIARTVEELKEVIARNPFAKRRDIDPRKLVVTFHAAHPSEEGCKKVRAVKADPEEIRISGREMYIYFPNGMGRTKLPMPAIAKALVPARLETGIRFSSCSRWHSS